MIKSLEEQLQELPPDLRQEVSDFIEFLIARRRERTRQKPTFSWAGALKDLGGQYTSVELQHRIAEWRIGYK